MIAALLLVIAGVIHLLPLSGVFGSASLERLYGVEIMQSDLVILMQHRAVLFGIMGGLMLFAAYAVAYRNVAIVMGLASTVSFLIIAYGAKEAVGPALRTVVYADIIAILALCGAAALTLATK